MKSFLLALGPLIVLSPLAFGQEKKTPVPDGAAQAESLKLIKELYKADYAQHRADDLGAFAEKLLKQAIRTTDDLVARFVLFREARDIAAQAGDAAMALRAIDELAKNYAIDAAEMKGTTLAAVGRAAITPSANKALVDAVVPLVESAIAGDHYELALRLLGTAASAARKANSRQVIERVAGLTKEATQVRQAFIRLKPYLEKLRQAHDDAEANTEVGKFLCFFKGEWVKGLPLLTKGADETLKGLAKSDLGRPAAVSEQLKLADGWWGLAEQEQGAARKRLQLRASHWYEKALPKTDGLTRTKVQSRIKLITEQYLSPPVPSRSVQPPQPTARWTFDSELRDTIGGLQGKLYRGAVIQNGRLKLNGKNSFMKTAFFRQKFRERTVELWLTFRTTSGMLFMVCEGAIWDGVVFGEGTPRTWSHRSSFNHRIGQFSADPDPAKPGELIHIVVVYAGDNSIAMYRNGKMYGKPIIPTGEAGMVQVYPAKRTFLNVGATTDASRSMACEIEEIRFYDRALTAGEVSTLFKAKPVPQR